MMQPYVSAQNLHFTPGCPSYGGYNKPETPPILDLSCKKDEHQVPSSCNSPLSVETHSRSPVSDLYPQHPPPQQQQQQQQQHSRIPDEFASEQRKTPFDSRSYHEARPSEVSHSPKERHYNSMYLKTEVTDGIETYQSSELPGNICHSNAPLTLHLSDQNGNSVHQVPPLVVSSGQTGLIPGGALEQPKKAPRPFKAYPKDPLAFTVNSAECMYDPLCNEEYAQFRKRMLESVRKGTEGTNVKMRRVSRSPGLPTSTMDEKDAAYWERRRKNNEAAKRSRDARRAKEDEIAIRAAFLEQENMRLKFENITLKNEAAKLRYIIYSK